MSLLEKKQEKKDILKECIYKIIPAEKLKVKPLCTENKNELIITDPQNIADGDSCPLCGGKIIIRD